MLGSARGLGSILGVAVAVSLSACSTDGDGGNTAGGGTSGAGGGTSGGAGGGTSGGAGGGTSGGAGGDTSGGAGGTSNGGGGSSSGGGGGTSNGGGGTSNGGGGSSSGGGGGTAGTGGSAGAAGSALCDQVADLQVEMDGELNCQGDPTAEANAQRRLCEIGHACESEMQTMYDCKRALDVSEWSCDTTDGHPQTNGNCSSSAFFACLGPALHAEDPFGCVAIVEAHDAAAGTLGCTPDDQLEFTCTQLYLRELCVSEWEALDTCMQAGNLVDNVECSAGDAGNTLVPKAGVCTSERTAFDDCLPN